MNVCVCIYVVCMRTASMVCNLDPPIERLLRSEELRTISPASAYPPSQLSRQLVSCEGLCGSRGFGILGDAS